METPERKRVLHLLSNDNFEAVICYSVTHGINPKEGLNRIVEEWREEKGRDKAEDEYRAKLSDSIEGKLDAIIFRVEKIDATTRHLDHMFS